MRVPPGTPAYVRVAQFTERHTAKVEVTGEIPVADTILPLCLQQLQAGFRKPVIVGASPTRGSSFSARGSRGTADPPDLESGSLERASRSAPTISHSRVAQQWSRQLLTGTVAVRIHSREPVLHGDHGVRAASLLVRQKARGQHPLVTPISSGDRASERLRLQPACAGSVTLAGLQTPRQ